MPKTTYVEDFYLLAGIVRLDIRRVVCARIEITKQMEQKTHSVFGHIHSRSCMKSRNGFSTSAKSCFPPKVEGCNECQRRSRDKSPLGMVGLNEEPVKGV